MTFFVNPFPCEDKRIKPVTMLIIPVPSAFRLFSILILGTERRDEIT